MNNILDRNSFNLEVLSRDNNECVICKDKFDLAVHHIIDRKCFSNGGYYKNNGISLCPTCHLKAENGVYTCDELRKFAGIKEIVLPDTFDPSFEYDKFGNTITYKLLKYPRTPHLEGSGISKDDDDEVILFNDILNKYLVIEEKIDGSSTAVSFNSDCELFLQCRGHFLGKGRDWPEFDQFKVWANTWKDYLFDILTDRYIMYGEYMGTFHSVFYDNLPHFFMEFDIWDKEEKYFLSTQRRQEILAKSSIPLYSVRVIKQGIYNDKEEILSSIRKSDFVSQNSPFVLEELLKKYKMSEDEISILLKLNKEQLMEGLYIKWEEDGIVKGRYKFVRPIFVQTILDYGKHWLQRQSIPNMLSPSANMFSMKQ